MKNVIYISNIVVPYRASFFELLSQNCDLTVIYERTNSKNRNNEWVKNSKNNYKKIFLKGINIKDEFTFDIKIFKYIVSKYDEIIFGCINSPIQIISIFLLIMLKRKYSINIDGEMFIEENGLKNKIKKIILNNANKCYVAGNTCKKKIEKKLNKKNIFSYRFSSLTENEITMNSKNRNKYNPNSEIIVVGQYMDYKGIDIALNVAKEMSSEKFNFIGAGKKSDELIQKVNALKVTNVKVTPFLQKNELYKKYQNCKLFILPSKKECWGLVINEAASFGTPIVSTYGSGAAIEFLSDKYSDFLAKPNNEQDLYNKVMKLLEYDHIKEYQDYLIEKSKLYTIEKSVEDTLKGIENSIN